MEIIKLYRAVSFAEKEDILRLNGFRAILGGFEGKQFVETQEDAVFFQSNLPKLDGKEYFTVEVAVDYDILTYLHKKTDTDITTVYTVYESVFGKFNKSIINIQFL